MTSQYNEMIEGFVSHCSCGGMQLSGLNQGLNQLQQVEILEIAKCNLIKIPPSLEELWAQWEHSIFPRIGPVAVKSYW